MRFFREKRILQLLSLTFSILILSGCTHRHTPLSPSAATPTPTPTPIPTAPTANTENASAKASTPAEGSPKIETPKIETPKIETPKIETPKIETPKIETPKIETPKIETPKIETPLLGDPNFKSEVLFPYSVFDMKNKTVFPFVNADEKANAADFRFLGFPVYQTIEHKINFVKNTNLLFRSIIFLPKAENVLSITSLTLTLHGLRKFNPKADATPENKNLAKQVLCLIASDQSVCSGDFNGIAADPESQKNLDPSFINLAQLGRNANGSHFSSKYSETQLKKTLATLEDGSEIITEENSTDDTVLDLGEIFNLDFSKIAETLQFLNDLSSQYSENGYRKFSFVTGNQTFFEADKSSLVLQYVLKDNKTEENPGAPDKIINGDDDTKYPDQKNLALFLVKEAPEKPAFSPGIRLGKDNFFPVDLHSKKRNVKKFKMKNTDLYAFAFETNLHFFSGGFIKKESEERLTQALKDIYPCANAIEKLSVYAVSDATLARDPNSGLTRSMKIKILTSQTWFSALKETRPNLEYSPDHYINDVIAKSYTAKGNLASCDSNPDCPYDRRIDFSFSFDKSISKEMRKQCTKDIISAFQKHGISENFISR